MTAERYWIGSVPKCDICSVEQNEVFIDGKTHMGPWAMMCHDCHTHHGLGLGLGLGQKYKYRASDKKWVKVDE
jgi:hypothetical protein